MQRFAGAKTRALSFETGRFQYQVSDMAGTQWRCYSLSRFRSWGDSGLAVAGRKLVLLTLAV